MLFIDNKIIHADVINEQFVCNLNACKGACCVQGDGGATLERIETFILEDIYPIVKPYLTPEGINEITTQGNFVKDEQGNFSTPLINGGACVYLNYDELGIAKCGIQAAHFDGKIDFIKPISCHLYPIRVYKELGVESLKYEQWEICKDACTLGKQLKVPVYEFLKEPLIRKYGEEFYKTIDATVKHLKNNNISLDADE